MLIRCKLTIDVKMNLKYIYNSNDVIIIRLNKESNASNHMVLLNKAVKIHNVL